MGANAKKLGITSFFSPNHTNFFSHSQTYDVIFFFKLSSSNNKQYGVAKKIRLKINYTNHDNFFFQTKKSPDRLDRAPNSSTYYYSFFCDSIFLIFMNGLKNEIPSCCWMKLLFRQGAVVFCLSALLWCTNKKSHNTR